MKGKSLLNYTYSDGLRDDYYHQKARTSEFSENIVLIPKSRQKYFLCFES